MSRICTEESEDRETINKCIDSKNITNSVLYSMKDEVTDIKIIISDVEIKSEKGNQFKDKNQFDKRNEIDEQRINFQAPVKDDLGDGSDVKNDDLEAKDKNVKNEDLDVKNEDLDVKNEDLEVKNEDLDVNSDDLDKNIPENIHWSSSDISLFNVLQKIFNNDYCSIALILRNKNCNMVNI